MKKVKHVQVRNSKWKVLWRSLQHDEPDETLLGRTLFEEKIIEIDTYLSESLTAEIAAHEFAHAFFPDLNEETVDMFGRQLINFLSNLGLVYDEEEEDELK